MSKKTFKNSRIDNQSALTYWLNVVSDQDVVNKEGTLPLGSPLPLKKVLSRLERDAGVKIRPLLKRKGALVLLLNGMPAPDLLTEVKPGDSLNIWQPLMGG